MISKENLISKTAKLMRMDDFSKLFPSNNVGAILLRLATTLGCKHRGRFNSLYRQDDLDNGETLTIRIANHNANKSYNTTTYTVSIVISKQKGATSLLEEKITEYTYGADCFIGERKNRTLRKIFSGINNALKTGVYKTDGDGLYGTEDEEERVSYKDIFRRIYETKFTHKRRAMFDRLLSLIEGTILPEQEKKDFKAEVHQVAMTAFKQENYSDEEWKKLYEATEAELMPTGAATNKTAKPKAPKLPKAYDERVNKPLAQVTLARRFVRLHDKFFTPETHAKAANILTALQRAIFNREIRKEGHGDKSAYCTEMRAMQEALIHIVKQNPMSNKRLTIDNLEAFLAVAKAQGSLTSADAIRKFISLSGKKPEQKRAQSALDKINRVIASGEAGKHADDLAKMRISLKSYIAGTTDYVRPVGQASKASITTNVTHTTMNPTTDAMIAAMLADSLTPSLVEEIGEDEMYIGYCAPTCKGEDDPQWLIKHMTKDEAGIRRVFLANGSRLMNQRWSERKEIKYMPTEVWAER